MKAMSLSGECSIYEISSLHQKVLKGWKGDSPLKLDLSKVKDIDASFVQLIMSCKHSATQHNQSFEMLNVTDELSEKFKAMYVDDFINGPAPDSSEE